MKHKQISSGEYSGRGKPVAIFVPSLRGGGAERVMTVVANGMDARGFEVDLVLAQREGPYLEELNPGVNIINLEAPRILRAFLPLVRYLRQRKPQVMLSALTHANLMAIAARSLSRSDCRIVVSQRNAPTLSSAGGINSIVVRTLRRRLYSHADGIVAVSEGVARALAQDMGVNDDRIEVIYNPLDIQRIERLARQGNDHPWLQPGSTDVFLAVGRLSAEKGYCVLLRAFARLLEKREAKLLILGEGPLLGDLRRLSEELGIDDHVDFVGFQKNPYAWMSRCDVYVLSSTSEGLPNSLMQAMACGAKIVSTNCDFGPAEILENGRWGTLVPVGDIQAFADAMEFQANSVEAPDVKARATQFGVSQIVDQYASSLGLTAAHSS